MDKSLKERLEHCEIDVEQAVHRFADNEELYLSCLEMFADDPTMIELKQAIDECRWDEAFTAAHAMKGVTGNMGCASLFHTTAEMVIRIRNGQLVGINQVYEEMKHNYDEIVVAIRQYYIAKGECI